MEKSPICSEGFTPKTKAAALFTTAVLHAATLLCLMPVMLFVVPAFESMYADIGLSLPAPTQLILHMSRYWYLAIPLLAVVPLLHIFSMRFVAEKLHGWAVSPSSPYEVALYWLAGIMGWLFWLGLLCGFIVISLYLPLVSIIENIQ